MALAQPVPLSRNAYMRKEKESKLVYSSDPALNRKCPRCRELVPECTCRKDETPAVKMTAILRIEKSGRAGKAVTVIDGLPKIESFLSELSAYLKSRLGAGGKFGYGPKGGYVEIQGEKRDQVRGLLQARGIQTKG